MILKCIRYLTMENLLLPKEVRTLNTKIYKYMTSVSKNVYALNLDYIINKQLR